MPATYQRFDPRLSIDNRIRVGLAGGALGGRQSGDFESRMIVESGKDLLSRDSGRADYGHFDLHLITHSQRA